MIQGLGKKLKNAREIQNLSQKDLAKILNTSASCIGMYEQGKREPNLEMLSKLCLTLNLSADRLLDLESNKAGTIGSTGLTQKEILLIKKYRRLDPKKQEAINTLIGIENNNNISEDIAKTISDNITAPTKAK